MSIDKPLETSILWLTGIFTSLMFALGKAKSQIPPNLVASLKSSFVTVDSPLNAWLSMWSMLSANINCPSVAAAFL